MYDSRKLSEYKFGERHQLFMVVLAFAIAGISGYAFSGWVHSGREKNMSECFPAGESNDISGDHIRNHSIQGVLWSQLSAANGISKSRYLLAENMTPACSLFRSPIKQTGLYEKGDCYQ